MNYFARIHRSGAEPGELAIVNGAHSDKEIGAATEVLSVQSGTGKDFVMTGGKSCMTHSGKQLA